MTSESPAVLAFTYTDGIRGIDGAMVACPVCGQGRHLLVQALADVGELVDDPSYVRCPRGHLWAEVALPRRYVLAPVLAVIAANPEGWQEMNRIAGEQGGAVGIDGDGEVC
ncbi:hypothetical protein ACWDUI_23735 [Streptosporangium sandarakinum]